MEFVVKKEDINSALNIARKAVSSRALFSIYQNIKIVAEQEKVTFTGTDGELTIKSSCDAEVKTTGTVFVKMDLFASLVGSLNTKELLVTWQDNKLHIKSEGTKSKSIYAYKTVEDENNRFPNVNYDENSLFFSYPSYIMKRIFGETVFAAVNDAGSSPAHFTHGVLFKFYDKSLDIVATDAHRMALRTIEFDKSQVSAPIEQVLIPTNVIAIVQSCLSDDKNLMLNFYKQGNKVFIQFDDVTVCSNLIDVSFPDYKRIILKNINQSIELDREEYKNALNRILIMAKYNTKNPAIHMSGNDNIIKLELDNDLVNCEENIEAVNTFGEFKIAFNPELLIDCLKAVNSDRIIIRWVSEKDPMMLNLKSKDKDTWVEDNEYKYLLMPVRT